MSFAEAGVALPQLLPNFRIGLGAIGMSAATWATFSDQETLETTRIHPVILGGTLRIGGTSEPVPDLLRAYGSVKMLLGTTKTPYDDLSQGTDDLVDDKLTYGLFATFGLEVVGGSRSTFFVEGGGGFRSLVVDDEEDRNTVTAAWLGSGAMIRLGSGASTWALGCHRLRAAHMDPTGTTTPSPARLCAKPGGSLGANGERLWNGNIDRGGGCVRCSWCAGHPAVVGCPGGLGRRAGRAMRSPMAPAPHALGPFVVYQGYISSGRTTTTCTAAATPPWPWPPQRRARGGPGRWPRPRPGPRSGRAGTRGAPPYDDHG
jgi:hypothetical protein